MGATLPLLASYLESLPGGITAHPECAVKASVLRTYLDDRPLGRDVPLPPALRALIDDPPPVSSWIPEVLFNAMAIAFRETHFADNDEAGYLAWVHDKNRKLLSTTLYRALFLLVSPERLLVGMEKRWGSFRRGTTPSVVRLDDHLIELRVRSPPRLYCPLVVNGMAEALRAAVTCAGAADASAQGTIRSAVEVAYRIRWR